MPASIDDEHRRVVPQRGEAGAELRRGAARLAAQPDAGQAGQHGLDVGEPRPRSTRGTAGRRRATTPASRAPPTKPAPPITTNMKIGQPAEEVEVVRTDGRQLRGVDRAAEPGDGRREHEDGQPGADEVEPEGGAGRLAVAHGQQPAAERAAPDRHHEQATAATKATTTRTICDFGDRERVRRTPAAGRRRACRARTA